MNYFPILQERCLDFFNISVPGAGVRFCGSGHGCGVKFLSGIIICSELFSFGLARIRILCTFVLSYDMTIIEHFKGIRIPSEMPFLLYDGSWLFFPQKTARFSLFHR